MASAALSCIALLALVLIPVALYLAVRLRPSVGRAGVVVVAIRSFGAGASCQRGARIP